MGQHKLLLVCREKPSPPERAPEVDLGVFALDSRAEVRSPLRVGSRAGSRCLARGPPEGGGSATGTSRSLATGRARSVRSSQDYLPTDTRARQYPGPSLGVSGICYSWLLYGACTADETRVLSQGFTNETATCVTDELKRAGSLGARHHCPSQGLWAEKWATARCCHNEHRLYLSHNDPQKRRHSKIPKVPIHMDYSLASGHEIRPRQSTAPLTAHPAA